MASTSPRALRAGLLERIHGLRFPVGAPQLRCGLAAAEGTPCSNPNPEEPHGDRLSAWLSIIKANLGPAEWKLFKLHWLSGLKGAELATRSGLSGNALACRLYRLKLKVRDILARLKACQQSQ